MLWKGVALLLELEYPLFFVSFSLSNLIPPSFFSLLAALYVMSV